MTRPTLPHDHPLAWLAGVLDTGEDPPAAAYAAVEQLGSERLCRLALFAVVLLDASHARATLAAIRFVVEIGDVFEEAVSQCQADPDLLAVLRKKGAAS